MPSMSSLFALAFHPLLSTPMAYWLSVYTTMGSLGGERSSARPMAVSSAILFVASPKYSEPSVIVVPSGATRMTPKPAGPGLPVHAPSVYAA